MPNRLAQETSPYLQQHAENPVDWYPWGEEALAAARDQDKPILLSIGYSACHWCHVMAHESFEDSEVAGLMNRLFINIKVDREERPDLDQIYQLAHQMMTQRAGGWPLTMFLTPQQTPFFGGTYFPKMPRYGLPGFADLLKRVAQYYGVERAQAGQQGEAVASALGRLQPVDEAQAFEFSAAPIERALQDLGSSFDAHDGGFGGAPKFPHPTELELCLRRHAESESATGAPTKRGAEAGPLHMAAYTLQRMALGGIYDQLGGGFCRYSVDERWLIPHFEKMLYDNGALLARYADAWAITRDPLFARVVEETAGWAMREMQSASGGYYSSFDADSEHEEGKFYVWTPEQVRALLDAEEFAVCASHYGLDQAANFEGCMWHLHVARELAEVAARLELPLAECGVRLQSAKAKLFAARAQRVPPGRDEKILTSWNALMITGMARAARVFARSDWQQSARAALQFIRAELWREGSAQERPRLLATYKDGRAHLNAYLDDHAYLLAALIECMQLDFDPRDLEWAEALAEVLLQQFYDQARGGFFFTSHDHEKLIHRLKPVHDGATPSGNGVAAFALQRLGHLTGSARYLDAATRTLQAFHTSLAQHPSGCASLLMALEEELDPPRVLVLRGPEKEMRRWTEELNKSYQPRTMTIAVAAGAVRLPQALDKPPREGGVNAWVCKGVTSLAPIDDLIALQGVLKSADFR